jgi:hypothetical protein
MATLLGNIPAANVRSTFVYAMQQMGIRADLWPQGGVMSTLLTEVSQAFASFFSVNVTASIAAGWLPTASGGWLKWLAFYVYGLNSSNGLSPGTFASGNVVLTNTGGGIFPPGGGSYAVGEVKVQDVITGQTYSNSASFSLAAGPGTTATVPIVADVLGTIANANPNDISRIVTTMLGVTCANPNPVLGLDPPSDLQIRQLCYNSLGARSVRGPRTAFAFAIQIALNTSTQTPVNINRWTISSSSHTGQITVTVASPSGVPLSSDVTGVATSIEAVARPECVTVTTQGATGVTYNGAITVYVYQFPGVTAALVQAAVATAIANYFALFPIGGLTADGFTGFHVTGLNGAIASSFFGVYAVDNTGGDVVMTGAQVMVEGTVTITVRLSTS